MEFLRTLGRFILAQIAIIAFLMFAPALMLAVPFALIAHGCRDLALLALLEMAAGPFVSGVWLAFFMSVRRVLRTTTFGNRTAASCGIRVQIASCGWALVGFFGTLVAEVAFNFAFRALSKSPTVYFALAPFVVFSPLLLVWARNTFAGL